MKIKLILSTFILSAIIPLYIISYHPISSFNLSTYIHLHISNVLLIYYYLIYYLLFKNNLSSSTPYEIWNQYKQSKYHNYIKSLSEDVFNLLPENYLIDYKNPCWHMNHDFKCLPYFNIIGNLIWWVLKLKCYFI